MWLSDGQYDDVSKLLARKLNDEDVQRSLRVLSKTPDEKSLHFSPKQWRMIVALIQGKTFEEIATNAHMRTDNLRRVLRLAIVKNGCQSTPEFLLKFIHTYLGRLYIGVIAKEAHDRLLAISAQRWPVARASWYVVLIDMRTIDNWPWSMNRAAERLAMSAGSVSQALIAVAEGLGMDREHPLVFAQCALAAKYDECVEAENRIFSAQQLAKALEIRKAAPWRKTRVATAPSHDWRGSIEELLERVLDHDQTQKVLAALKAPNAEQCSLGGGLAWQVVVRLLGGDSIATLASEANVSADALYYRLRRVRILNGLRSTEELLLCSMRVYLGADYVNAIAAETYKSLKAMSPQFWKAIRLDVLRRLSQKDAWAQTQKQWALNMKVVPRTVRRHIEEIAAILGIESTHPLVAVYCHLAAEYERTQAAEGKVVVGLFGDYGN